METSEDDLLFGSFFIEEKDDSKYKGKVSIQAVLRKMRGLQISKRNIGQVVLVLHILKGGSLM